MRILLASSTISENGGGISSYGLDFLKLMGVKNECYVLAGDIMDERNKSLIKDSYLLNSKDFSSVNLFKFLDLIKVIKPDVIVNSDFQLMSLAIPFIAIKVIKISISHFVDGEHAIVAGFNHRYYNNIIALSNEGKMFLERFYKIRDTQIIK